MLIEAEKVYASERKRGYSDGMEAAALQTAKLVSETSQKVDRYLASLDKEVANLALSIVRNVLNEFDDDELVAKAASKAISDMRTAKAVYIKIHPSAEMRVRDDLTSIVNSAHEPMPVVTIETDDQLDTQSCILSTEFAVVEATIETQLAAIAEAIGLPESKAVA